MNGHKEKKNCRVCGKEFEEYKYRKKKYCSHDCYSKDIKNILGKKEARACIYCGKTFLIQPSRNKRFCSTSCAGIVAWENEEYSKNMSEKHKGERPERKGVSINVNHDKQFKKGMTPWNKGNGDLSENERDRNDIRYKEWREGIFKRDDYTCKKCKIKGYILHPHHIKNFAQYKKDRFDVNNGITLCKDCHYLFHNTYGYRNNNINQLKEFLEEQNIII